MFTIRAFAIIFDERGRVLLCRRPDCDVRNLPGGNIQGSEPPTRAVVRVVEEILANTSSKQVERIHDAMVPGDRPLFRRQTAPSTHGMLAGRGAAETEHSILQDYLGLLDSQRVAVFASLNGLEEGQIWQRPAPGEWCMGEILSHTVRFFACFLPGLQAMWLLCGWYGRLRRHRPYSVEIENVYKRPGFPMWTGFLWPPKHRPRKPVPLAALKAEVESTHRRVRTFYSGKDEDVLGNIYAYDPAIGVVNLITALKVGIDHDQLHYDDILRMATALEGEANPGDCGRGRV